MAHIRRAKSGQGWEARYLDPMQKERARTFRTKREAELFLGRQSADIQRGDYLDPRLARTTFDRWAEEWLATTVHLKPKTQASYESILRKRVLPVFEKARIAAVEQVDVRRFVAELAASGDEPGTIRNTFNVLRLVFGTAVGSGAIRANPCTGVRMPKSSRSEMLFIGPEEILRLAEAITPTFRTLVLFAAYTGLRAGEIGALRVGHLDLLRGTVDVRESLADVKGKLVFGPTKTYAHRTARLPRFLCDELRDHLASRSHRPEALVFTGPTGVPLRHNLFYARHFKPAVLRAGLPGALRFHDLRHSCAALLIAQGGHPKAIMERLGHSSIQVTLDRYGHLFPGLDEALTDGLEVTYRASVAAFSRHAGPGRGRAPMSDASLLPFESEIRADEPPAGALFVIRARPLTIEKLAEEAHRQERAFSYRGAPLASVNVDAVVAGLDGRGDLARPDVEPHLVRDVESRSPARGGLRTPADVRRSSLRRRAVGRHGRSSEYSVGVVRAHPAQPVPTEEVKWSSDTAVRIDIPCDVQQVDQTGLVWTFRDEARDPSVIMPNAIVISADEEDPVPARVVDLVPHANGTIVHLEILPGDPLEYAEALSRARLRTAG